MNTTIRSRRILAALCPVALLVILTKATPAKAGLEPDVPEHFLAAPGDQQIRLSWRAPARAVSYTVKAAATAAGPFTNLLTGLTTTAVSLTSLTNGRTYHYVVSAVNEHGASDNSAALSAVPSAAVLDWLPAGAKVEKLAGGFQFVEGPVWVPADGGYLIFSDINANRLIRWSPRAGGTTFRTPSGQANGNTLDADGRLITCEHANRRVSRTESDGTVVTLVDRFRGLTFNAPNDVAVKSDGTIWFTDPNYGAGQTQPGRYVYRFHPSNGNATVTALVTNFDQPNGLCFSPDETKLYVADSGGPRHVRVFDVLPDNTLSTGQVFTAINPGAPDGMRVDASGRLFSSAGDGVQIFDADGTLEGRILTPEAAANLCFGGPNNEMLFITARTSLYGVTRRPDLIVTSVRRFPLSPRRGQSVLFSATVKNQGTAPTPAGTPLRLAFTIGTSTNAVWSDSFTDALPPDASVVLLCNAGVEGATWTGVGGNHTVRAFVDDQESFTESNETNNVLTLTMSVANTADSDGDGHDDSIESFAGTNPQDANSVLRLLAAERNGASVTFTWASVSNKIYHVACKGSFSDSVWSDLSPAITASNAVTSWTTAVPPNAGPVYFRVRVGP
jgi:gluconolactonase